MKKEESIRRYGEEKWETRLESSRRRYRKNYDRRTITIQMWKDANRNKIKEISREYSHKDGKGYARTRQYERTGVRAERNKVRSAHRYLYRQYKQIIASESQLHHQWLPGTANYRGVALVEKDQHLHGFIDVIRILEGEITLLTEAEIQNRRVSV